MDNDDLNKNIDESWKETAEKEKEELKKTGVFVPPEPDFKFFITTLALQASIALGVIANPTDNKQEQNIQQAKFLIDTIGMLKEKTKGNLDKEETELLDNVLYELRTHYIAQNTKGETK